MCAGTDVLLHYYATTPPLITTLFLVQAIINY